ncbi:MAG: hypothetical protein ISR47_02405 [Rhodospirillales bacterium]|nr:hypothetical protein [Rhodospirillales bacterium]
MVGEQTWAWDGDDFSELEERALGGQVAALTDRLGISHEGLKIALGIKENYKEGTPICVPGENTRILVPEHLLNQNLDLRNLDDPLPLAVVATRDPEPPMAIAAAARLCPLGNSTELVSGLFELVGETTKHPLVRQAVGLVKDNAFAPDAIAHIRRHASKFIVKTRTQYTAALRQNLSSLIEGVIAPRNFVKEFFELTEAGNLRHDIRRKLVLSLLISPNIRPSIKFLMLENFHRLSKPVRLEIISGVLQAEPTRHTDVIKEELRWIVAQERQPSEIIH